MMPDSQRQAQQKGQQVFIEVNTIPKEDQEGVEKEQTLYFPLEDMKVGELKQKIYEECDVLQTQLMSLQYNGEKMEDQQNIKYYFDNFGRQGQALIIIQNKKKLSEIKGLKLSDEVDPYEIDDQVVQMSCGHVIGQNGMIALFQALVESKTPEIKCPNTQMYVCNQEWDFDLCCKIAVLSTPDRQFLQERMAQFIISQNLWACPKCQHMMVKDSKTGNRVQCSNCKYPDKKDYCYKCNCQWKTKGTQFCGNERCPYGSIKGIVKTCPFDQPLFLFDQNNNKNKIMVPSIRACPKCKQIISQKRQIKQKHAYCYKCSTKFCWVCLKVQTKRKVLPDYFQCGNSKDYCGNVALNQIL